MPDPNQSTIIDFQHPWATDMPQQTRQLAYLLRAENIVHEVSGQTRKMGGAAKINGTAIAGGPDITGMVDYWKQGILGTSSQKFVVMTSDGRIYKEDMDGIYDDITGTVVTTDAIPVWCVARDTVIIATDKNNTLQKWDQVTAVTTTLGGSPPAGRGAVYHNGRIWVWSPNSDPCGIYYGSSTSIEDYTGLDTGRIGIDENDGDRIIGAVSHSINDQSVLFIFKGPNIGSITWLLGTAPTGADGYRRGGTIRGIPLQSPNSLVKVGNDIALMSNRGIHLLSRVLDVGNDPEADLTRYLRTFFREGITRNALNKVWGVNDISHSTAYWNIQSTAATEPDLVLGMCYLRVQDRGWLPLTWNRPAISLASRINPTTHIPEIVSGNTDGFVRRQDIAARNIDVNTSYSSRIQTPQILVGNVDSGGRPRGDQPVSLEDLYVRCISVGDYDLNVTLTRDKEAPPDFYAFNQGQSGFILGTSILGQDRLGGNKMQISHSDPPVFGEARAVALDITQGGLNQDMNLVEIGIEWLPMAQSDRAA
jgi:hypothetical protein